jgi:hypothetical protein
LAVAIWSGQTYLDAGLGGRALLCVGAQAAAVGFAVLARRAFAAQASVWGLALLVPAGACAAFAAIGIQHAWNAAGDTPLGYLAALLIAALEPCLFVSAELVEELRAGQAKRRAEEAADDAAREAERLAAREHQRTLERMKAGAGAEVALPLKAAGPATRSRPRLVQTAAAVAGVAITGQAGLIEPPAVTEVANDAAARDAAALALIAQGVTTRNGLARQAGISKHRAAQLLDMHVQGWRRAA